MKASRDISVLLEIMAALRTPETGCPWDLEQTFETIAPFTIEEGYEVADAIERGAADDLKDELGDLLLQVVFHARMAQEQGLFDFGDVCQAITEKLIRRHPHVFGDGAAKDPQSVKQSWEQIKADERARRHKARPSPASLLDDVPIALPGLMRAIKLQRRAGQVGFDWNDAEQVIEKIRDEVAEVEEEVVSGNASRAAEEIGDLLFAVANLARHLDVDPEAALRATNEKFRRRFAFIESHARESGRELKAVSLDEMENWWQAAKAVERA